jgi:hypothetical protein
MKRAGPLARIGFTHLFSYSQKTAPLKHPTTKGKLRLLKCVVLEACETGLGTLSAKTSFGLTRTFA